MLANPFETLNDNDLEQSLLTLAATERDVNADIILHLLVVKERRLYAPAGFDSLFSYCTGRLGFSRSTSYRRKAVVDKARDFPDLIERLRSGRLQLCAAAAVAPHLEPDSAAELLAAVEGLSHREVEAFMVKTWRARSETREASPRERSETEGGLKLDARSHEASAAEVAPSAARPIPRTVVRPVAANASRVSVTLSDRTLESMKRAKELLGGKTDDEILYRALERLLDQVAPERRQERRRARIQQRAESSSNTGERNQRPRLAPPESSRRGRLADRDHAIVAGGTQCTFVSRDGIRCEAKTFLEVDHIRPWALGGGSTRENQRALCRTHNAYLAAHTFGPWSGRKASSQRWDDA